MLAPTVGNRSDSPLAPATIETHASLGGSYRLDKKRGINSVYIHAFGNTVNGTSAFTGPQSGYVRMEQNMLQIGYSHECGSWRMQEEHDSCEDACLLSVRELKR